MWWQILPSMTIITGLVGSIFVLLPINSYMFHDRPTRRGLTEFTVIQTPQKQGFRRDVYMFGNEYISSGLDNLPDE